MLLEIYDIETLANVFTYVSYDVTNKQWHEFVISDWRNDYNKLYDHLFRDKICHVGYNNNNFDYPVLHHMINHHNEYCNMGGQLLAQNIYKKAQSIIEQEFSTVSDKNKHIFQIDLFQIWHYSNKARMTSLALLAKYKSIKLRESP